MTDKIDRSADLVVRLRDYGQHEREEMNHTWRRFRKERLEAADAIDALRAEVERLRAACSGVLAWDARRKYSIPYGVRDPLVAALKGGEA